jgi:2-haloacid dehalogenase
MSENPIDRVTTLTFDVFGTVLDLSGSLVPPVSRFLTEKGASVDAASFWVRWRERQRVEQYQDNLLMLGHSGYLETCRRAFVYCLRTEGVEFTDEDVAEFMKVYQGLSPFDDAVEGLNRLAGHYRLVALSNGEQWYLEHLVKNRIKTPFDAIISVERAGAFKPHPSVYRTAATILESDPHRIMMVAAHSFDIMGARASGYRGAFVNRYRLPFEESPYQPDLVVNDFVELASRLLGD